MGDYQYNRLSEILGLDGNSFDETRLEEYIQENLVPRYDKELDKRDVFVLAKISALLSQRGCILLRQIMSRDGNLDLNKVFEYRCSQIDYFDHTTRSLKKTITSLTIGKTWKQVDYPEEFYILLGQFTRLRDLTVYGCSSFELLFENLLAKKDTCFSNLLSLRISISHNANPIACLVNLGTATNANGLISRKLERLEFVGPMQLDESVLEDFFFCVLPLFPKLSSFSVESNKVKSFQKIAQRLYQQENGIQTNPRFRRLRDLDLGVCNHNAAANDNYEDTDNDDTGNDDTDDEKVRGMLRHNQLEIEAVATILKSFPGLNIKRYWRWGGTGTGSHIRGACPIHPSLEYLLEINHAGRVLLLRRSTRRDAHNDNNTTDATASPFKLPLSVWPLVLARAGKVGRRANLAFRPSPNAIYYLFRNAPELHPQAIAPSPMSVTSTIQSHPRVVDIASQSMLNEHTTIDQSHPTVNDIENQEMNLLLQPTSQNPPTSVFIFSESRHVKYENFDWNNHNPSTNLFVTVKMPFFPPGEFIRVTPNPSASQNIVSVVCRIHWMVMRTVAALLCCPSRRERVLQDRCQMIYDHGELAKGRLCYRKKFRIAYFLSLLVLCNLLSNMIWIIWAE